MIRCVLMDIEGTILSVAFVRDVLFPYSQRRLISFLEQHRHNSTVRDLTAQCLDTIAQETGEHAGYEELPTILRRWIEDDRKHAGLKTLQGLIWRRGIEPARLPLRYMPMSFQYSGYGTQAGSSSPCTRRDQYWRNSSSWPIRPTETLPASFRTSLIPPSVRNQTAPPIG